MVEGNLKENSLVKAEKCNPEEFCSGLQTCLRIELCVYYLLSGFRKVLRTYSPLLKGRSLSSCM